MDDDNTLCVGGGGAVSTHGDSRWLLFLRMGSSEPWVQLIVEKLFEAFARDFIVHHLLSSAPWLLGTPGTNRANFFAISREEVSLLLGAWQSTPRQALSPPPPAMGCQALQ